MSESLFTATQIANALGKSPRALRKALAAVPAGSVIVAGRPAAAGATVSGDARLLLALRLSWRNTRCSTTR